jgi:hypothetical protein
MVHTPQRSESLRDDIAHRVALFRERQRRFNEARETYSAQMLARARADLERIGPRSGLVADTAAAVAAWPAPEHG